MDPSTLSKNDSTVKMTTNNTNTTMMYASDMSISSSSTTSTPTKSPTTNKESTTSMKNEKNHSHNHHPFQEEERVLKLSRSSDMDVSSDDENDNHDNDNIQYAIKYKSNNTNNEKQITTNDDNHNSIISNNNSNDTDNNNNHKINPILKSIYDSSDHNRSWHIEILTDLFLRCDEYELQNINVQSSLISLKEESNDTIKATMKNQKGRNDVQLHSGAKRKRSYLRDKLQQRHDNQHQQQYQQQPSSLFPILSFALKRFYKTHPSNDNNNNIVIINKNNENNNNNDQSLRKFKRKTYTGRTRKQLERAVMYKFCDRILSKQFIKHRIYGKEYKSPVLLHSNNHNHNHTNGNLNHNSIRGGYSSQSHESISLMYNECSLAAISKWSIPPDSTFDTQVQQPLQQDKDKKKNCNLKRVCRVPVASTTFRKCMACNKFGHYEVECEQIAQKRIRSAVEISNWLYNEARIQKALRDFISPFGAYESKLDLDDHIDSDEEEEAINRLDVVQDLQLLEQRKKELSSHKFVCVSPDSVDAETKEDNGEAVTSPAMYNADNNDTTIKSKKKGVGYDGCGICFTKYNAEEFLICDGCDKHYHMQCVDLSIDEIPDGDWFCPHCDSYSSDVSSVVEIEALDDFIIEQRKLGEAETLKFEETIYDDQWHPSMSVIPLQSRFNQDLKRFNQNLEITSLPRDEEMETHKSTLISTSSKQLSYDSEITKIDEFFIVANEEEIDEDSGKNELSLETEQVPVEKPKNYAIEDLIGGIVSFSIDGDEKLSVGVLSGFDGLRRKVLVRIISNMGKAIQTSHRGDHRNNEDYESQKRDSYDIFSCTSGASVWIPIEAVVHISSGTQRRETQYCSLLVDNILSKARDDVRTDRDLHDKKRKSQMIKADSVANIGSNVAHYHTFDQLDSSLNSESESNIESDVSYDHSLPSEKTPSPSSTTVPFVKSPSTSSLANNDKVPESNRRRSPRKRKPNDAAANENKEESLTSIDKVPESNRRRSPRKRKPNDAEANENKEKKSKQKPKEKPNQKAKDVAMENVKKGEEKDDKTKKGQLKVPISPSKEQHDDTGTIFTVEEILNDRVTKQGMKEYLIKWKGFGNNENTWEIESNILDANVLRKYSANKLLKQLRVTTEAKKVKSPTAHVIKVIKAGIHLMDTMSTIERTKHQKNRCPFCNVDFGITGLRVHIKSHSESKNYELIKQVIKISDIDWYKAVQDKK